MPCNNFFTISCIRKFIRSYIGPIQTRSKFDNFWYRPSTHISSISILFQELHMLIHRQTPNVCSFYGAKNVQI
jgi:hypothetical protein